MTFESLNSVLDTILLTNVGREEQGVRVCGLKDFCDTLKNLLLVASLLFASLALTFQANYQKHPAIAVKLYWIGLIGVLPLLALVVLLIRQAFLVIDRFPVLGRSASTRGRLLTAAVVLLGFVGVAAGLVGLAVATLDKL